MNKVLVLLSCFVMSFSVFANSAKEESCGRGLSDSISGPLQYPVDKNIELKKVKISMIDRMYIITTESGENFRFDSSNDALFFELKKYAADPKRNITPVNLNGRFIMVKDAFDKNAKDLIPVFDIESYEVAQSSIEDLRRKFLGQN